MGIWTTIFKFRNKNKQKQNVRRIWHLWQFLKLTSLLMWSRSVNELDRLTLNYMYPGRNLWNCNNCVVKRDFAVWYLIRHLGKKTWLLSHVKCLFFAEVVIRILVIPKYPSATRSPATTSTPAFIKFAGLWISLFLFLFLKLTAW